MSTKTIAIMQPTFIPWVGYFSMIDQVDEFILLDDVQFDRRSWQQRNRIKGHNGEIMLSVPVAKKGLRDQMIMDVELTENSAHVFEKMLKTIDSCYAKTTCFAQYRDEFCALFQGKPQPLADLNIAIINWACEALGLSTPLIRSSTLHSSGKKDHKLLAICRARGATEYVSPVGAKAYLEQSTLFDEQGVELTFFNYDHPAYKQQFGAFLPYMGVIDLLFNEGPNALEIIRSGQAAPVISHP